jgi:GH15 family glucan-1,4-alpha-glucosidase
LALSPLVLDARFRDHQTEAVVDLMERLARKAIVVAEEPDAGIWEIRAEQQLQTFSSVMCWAGVDRMALISSRYRPGITDELRTAADRIRTSILDNAIDKARGNLVACFRGTEVDAALLQAIALRLFTPDDPRAHATVDAVRSDLGSNGWLHRYRVDDGFGAPTVAFVICTFWLIESLARIGRVAEARALMAEVASVKSPLGLLAEDLDPTTGTMWGNFPQAYSHVGLINAAFAASPSWTEVV